MPQTLVVLAAGMGSRYGGLKQIDPMGPTGETILDYSVFDALRAGFSKVVFIIRPDFEADFRHNVSSKDKVRPRCYNTWDCCRSAQWLSESAFPRVHGPRPRPHRAPRARRTGRVRRFVSSVRTAPGRGNHG